MAGVPMGYRATLYDLANKRQLEVYLEGDAFRTDRQIGGGPMPPGQGGGPPDHIWGGPIDPYPDHGLPGQPPHIWGPTDPRPTPPIYFPPNIKPPEPPQGGGNKPPPPDGGWGYVSDPGFGWGYFPAMADKPHPPPGEVKPPEDPNKPQVNPLGRR